MSTARDSSPLLEAQPTTKEEIVDRSYEQRAIEQWVQQPGSRALYIYGERGTGKTLVTRTTLRANLDADTLRYISCTDADTQYQVLQQMYQHLTGEEIGGGYHTAQLKNRVQNKLTGGGMTVVLDEIDFLLEQDGDDVLYFLSRMGVSTAVSVVAISSNYPDPSTAIEDRAFSSLQPSILRFEKYEHPEVADILSHYLASSRLDDSLPGEVVRAIGRRTSNIRFALLWLDKMLADDDVDYDRLNGLTRSAAVQRYRNAMLKDWSDHHRHLLTVLGEAVDGGDSARTGQVYDRYVALCREVGAEPLTARRVSEFITDLELLGLIIVEHIEGGTEGRTRKLQLRSEF